MPDIEVTEELGLTTTTDPIVEVTTEVVASIVEVGVVGPQGPKGDTGEPGVPVSYLHQQTTPSSTWTMNHNLGFKPSVELLNSGGQEIEGDVIHTSNNQTIANFVIPISGSARFV